MQSLVTTHQDVIYASFSPTMQVPTQPAGGGSGPPKEPETAAVKGELKGVNSGAQGWADATVQPPPPPSAAEAALENLCWISFGFQSQSVGPEGGMLSLKPSAGAIGVEEGESILLKVPPGAVSPSACVEVRSAVIPDGPFTLPEGYQLGSMVVYIHYDSRHVTQPLTFRLPHWYGGEDQVQDGLSFAIAPHALKEGERVYHFELLEGGRMLNGHCGELEIDGHCSLFAEVFKKGTMSRYQAISLQRERGNDTTCDVAVTYAFPLWYDVSAYAYVHTNIQCTCT